MGRERTGNDWIPFNVIVADVLGLIRRQAGVIEGRTAAATLATCNATRYAWSSKEERPIKSAFRVSLPVSFPSLESLSDPFVHQR